MLRLAIMFIILLGIFATEVYNKFLLKTKFSIKDIIAGIVGSILCYMVSYLIG